MEALTHRAIKSGKQYGYLFPPANLREETVKKGASVSDTVSFIPKVVSETLSQTKGIAALVRGNTLSQTCQNIWDFVYHHIRYQKDEEGKEQIRSPARTWHDRQRGVDCDCYTVFISSILINLKIPHRLRIARYKKDYFQHIYPIVPKPGGGYITIDCVVDYFNYEEPYTEIKDTNMDLQYLSGTDNEQSQEFSGEEQMGRLFRRKHRSGGGQKKGGFRHFLKKTLHVVNRLNPATVLLRNGVLAAMKLNLMKVAQRLKYAYLSEAEAQKRGIDMGKFQKLKKIKDKLEQIFFGAGGKPENLKKAILTGKGNRNKDVSGLGWAFGDERSSDYDEATPLPQLLGEEIYQSENLEGIEGTDDLGEPATAASVTAASGVIAVIAGLLKNIGNIFPKKQQEAQDFDSAESVDASKLPAEIEQSKEEITRLQTDPSFTQQSSNEQVPGDDESGGKDDSPKEGFWEKNKQWLQPALWGTAGLGLLYAGYRMLKGKNEKPPQKTLSGTKPRKKGRKKAVPLM